MGMAVKVRMLLAARQMTLKDLGARMDPPTSAQNIGRKIKNDNLTERDLSAIAEACARKIQADYVVTNQGPLAVSRAIKRVTPTELFDDIEAERGIVFDLVDF